MRSIYHLKIRKDDETKFQSALNTLNVNYDFKMTTNGDPDEGSFIDYTVSLSKYELLYVRLAVRIHKAINMSEWEAEQKIKAND